MNAAAWSPAHAWITVLALALCPTAWAQTPRSGERWTSPDGVFSVAIPTGWRLGEGSTATPGERLLIIDSPTMVAREATTGEALVRQCLILRRLNADDRRNQEEINAAHESDEVLDSLIRLSFPSAEHSRSNQIVQGVARVLSYDVEVTPSSSFFGLLTRYVQPDIELSAEPVRVMQRGFVVPTSEGTMSYSLTCYSNRIGEAPADIRAMSAFMSSLTFNR